MAPVNHDVQAEQIPNAYLDDEEDVAAAKSAFQAAFDDVVAGGLAAKQAPAPVDIIPEADRESTIPPNTQIFQYPLGYPIFLHYGGYQYGFQYSVPLFYPTTILHNLLYKSPSYI